MEECKNSGATEHDEGTMNLNIQIFKEKKFSNSAPRFSNLNAAHYRHYIPNNHNNFSVQTPWVQTDADVWIPLPGIPRSTRILELQTSPAQDTTVTLSTVNTTRRLIVVTLQEHEYQIQLSDSTCFCPVKKVCSTITSGVL